MKRITALLSLGCAVAAANADEIWVFTATLEQGPWKFESRVLHNDDTNHFDLFLKRVAGPAVEEDWNGWVYTGSNPDLFLRDDSGTFTWNVYTQSGSKSWRYEILNTQYQDAHWDGAPNSLILGGASLRFTPTGDDADLMSADYQFVGIVPEPASLAVLAAGLIALIRRTSC